jgi:hypothetical protein
VPDDDVGTGGTDLVDEARGDRLDDLDRQLRPDEPADVVRLDEGRQIDRGAHAPKTTWRTICHPCGAESRSA